MSLVMAVIKIIHILWHTLRTVSSIVEFRVRLACLVGIFISMLWRDITRWNFAQGKRDTTAWIKQAAVSQKKSSQSRTSDMEEQSF